MRLYYQSIFFFFQAEDGIRDLVRSRGLGDVYKRQSLARVLGESGRRGAEGDEKKEGEELSPHAEKVRPASYTHLTLPTSDLV